jgi:5-methyltetrahydrofolate--homocysteine methyltransferase
LDASRSVTVAGSLLNQEQKPAFLQGIQKEYEKLRDDFNNKKTVKQYLSLADAQKNKTKIDWAGFMPVHPTFTGIKQFDNYDLAEIRKYIDWPPFFIAWELHGKFPAILTDAVIGVEATKLYNDANALLDQIVNEKWLAAKGTIGFWPANSDGKDSVAVLNEKEGPDEVVHLQFLRQQIKKAEGQPNISLADFIQPAATDDSPPDSYRVTTQDYIGAFAVTIKGIEEYIKRFEAAHDDYNKITLQALADRLAEAFAELLHQRTRKEFWGYAKDETLSNEDLIKEQYMGIRPAPGYPACPDHTEKYKLFGLLGGEETTGIHLTESLAMYPASSVCGWYFAHPDSKYFGVGKIEKDQLADYAERKGMSLEDATRWLRPILE